jgi:hypothetical protein
MTGTTASGYPYVTPTDHPKEYPATSQALAKALEILPYSYAGIATGIASIAAAASLDVNITWPAGWFYATSPVVVGNANNGRLLVSVKTVTAAGATFTLTNVSTGASPVGVQLHWQATRR